MTHTKEPPEFPGRFSASVAIGTAYIVDGYRSSRIGFCYRLICTRLIRRLSYGQYQLLINV